MIFFAFSAAFFASFAVGGLDVFAEAGRPALDQLETYHYGFLFQMHAPDFLDALLDLVF